MIIARWQRSVASAGAGPRDPRDDTCHRGPPVRRRSVAARRRDADGEVRLRGRPLRHPGAAPVLDGLDLVVPPASPWRSGAPVQTARPSPACCRAVPGRGRRVHPHRQRGRHDPRPALVAAGGRDRLRGHLPLQRQRNRQHRLRRPRRVGGPRSSGPPGSPAPTSSSSGCRGLRHRRSGQGLLALRAGSASASPSPAIPPTRGVLIRRRHLLGRPHQGSTRSRDAMREVATGRTTLVIAHRPATIALADRVVLERRPGRG